MNIQYHEFMTPMWLARQSSAPAREQLYWGAAPQINDVQVYVPADTRFNETVFCLPLLPANRLRSDSEIVVQITAGLEYRQDWGYGRGKKGTDNSSTSDLIAQILGRIRFLTEAYNTLAEAYTKLAERVGKIEAELQSLRAQITSLQAQINSLRWWRRDPMCIMISDHDRAAGFEIRDPSGYKTHGPYRGVEGYFGERGLIDSTYIPEGDIQAEAGGKGFLGGVLAPTKQDRWPQVFRMNLVIPPRNGQVWGTINSDIDGGHGVSVSYSQRLNDIRSKGLYFTVYRGERNEAYTINYFEVTVYQ